MQKENSTHFSESDRRCMKRALALAKKGIGLTSPNPCVGAVIVKNGKIIGEGFHLRAGLPHAEINAIAAAKKKKTSLVGATIYVTLEPCSTFGRTPPCVKAIINEKFSRVVVAATDPNPRHAGKGLRLLRRAGIEVENGLFAEEATELNHSFNHWITTGHPWIVAKIAQSLDGRIAPPKTDTRWLSCAESLHRAHQLRWESDAIMIGAETARIDNPKLTIRLPGRHPQKVQPWRIVMTRSGRLPKNLHLFTDNFKERTLVFRKRSIEKVMKNLGKRGVTHVLLEGGGTLLGEAFAAGLVNEIAFFVTPFLLGSGPGSIEWPKNKKLKKRIVLKKLKIEKSGVDLFYRALV